MACRDRRSRAVRANKAERFRRYVNAKFDDNLTTLHEAFKQSFDADLFQRGRQCLILGDHEQFAGIIELMTGPVVIECEIEPEDLKTVEAEEQTAPVFVKRSSESLLERNQMLNVKGSVYVDLDPCQQKQCDIRTCESCPMELINTPLSIDSTCTIVYTPPGVSTSAFELSVPPSHRGRIYNTDHVVPGQSVPAQSLVLTHRLDVLNSFQGIKIAFVPYMRHCLGLWSVKYPRLTQQSFAHILMQLNGCYVIRRNSPFATVFKFRRKA